MNHNVEIQGQVVDKEGNLGDYRVVLPEGVTYRLEKVRGVNVIRFNPALVVPYDSDAFEVLLDQPTHGGADRSAHDYEDRDATPGRRNYGGAVIRAVVESAAPDIFGKAMYTHGGLQLAQTGAAQNTFPLRGNPHISLWFARDAYAVGNALVFGAVTFNVYAQLPRPEIGSHQLNAALAYAARDAGLRDILYGGQTTVSDVRAESVVALSFSLLAVKDYLDRRKDEFAELGQLLIAASEVRSLKTKIAALPIAQDLEKSISDIERRVGDLSSFEELCVGFRDHLPKF